MQLEGANFCGLAVRHLVELLFAVGFTGGLLRCRLAKVHNRVTHRGARCMIQIQPDCRSKVPF